MRCREEKISALVDGDLSPREERKWRAHVEGCLNCRRAHDQLVAMKAALAAEAAESPEPRDAGWSALVEKLNRAERQPRTWSAWWLLAPAALAIAAGVGTWRHFHAAPAVSDDQLIAEAESEFRKADAQYQRALDKLRSVAERARVDWPEARRRDFDGAQAALEAATEKCRAVARARPADGDAEELLFAAYRKQISFFQDQLLRGGAL